MDAGGVVLAGGGSFGAYEVGVLEALLEGRWARGKHGAVEVSVFSGTSVGAYNAAFLAASTAPSTLQRLRELRQLWVRRIAEIPGEQENGVFRFRGSAAGYLANPNLGNGLRIALQNLLRDSLVLSRNWLRRGLDIPTSPDPGLRRLVRPFDLSDLISSSPLQRLIKDTIAAERLFQPGAGKLQIVTTQWDWGKVAIFENRPSRVGTNPETRHQHRQLTPENTSSAIRASAAIPGLFRPIQLSRSYFADGGILMNAPLRPALSAGVSELHVIHLEPGLEAIPHGRAPSAFETFERILTTVPAGMIGWDFSIAKSYRSLIEVAHALEEGLGSGESSDQSPDLEGSPEARRLRALRSDEKILRFLRKFARKNLVNIHKHFPTHFAGGAFRLLDFRLESLLELIDQGFSDAVHHDCEANGCIVGS